jgi:hypothetical protein
LLQQLEENPESPADEASTDNITQNGTEATGNTGPLSTHARLAIQLRLAEKKILQNASRFASEYRSKLHEQLQQQLEKLALEKTQQAANALQIVNETENELDNLDDLDLQGVEVVN